MKVLNAIVLFVLLSAFSLLPASGQTYLPFVANENSQQSTSQPDKAAEILAALEAEGVDPATIDAVRAELLAKPSTEAAQSVSAQTADSDALYTGCLLRAGVIINVAIGEQPQRPCSKRTDQISWNQRGPQGEVGPQGAPGEMGPAGPQGEPGVIGFYTRRVEFSVPAGVNVLADGFAFCDFGDQVTGGGFLTGSAYLALRSSLPMLGGWHVTVENTSELASGMQVFAVCADLTP